MEITKNTPLSEIFNNQDVADEMSEIEGSLLRTIDERMNTVSAQIRAGGLGQGMLVNGEPLFYNEALQICSDYLILSSNITMLVADIKSAACDKELEELRKLKNLLLKDNDRWQALKEQYEREFRDLISNDQGDLINEPGPHYEEYREEYYGPNGKITRVQKHIDENNEKIEEIKRRISTVTGSSSSGGSSSSEGSSTSGGTRTSSGGGTHSGTGRDIPDSTDSPSEAPTEAPGEPATEAPTQSSESGTNTGSSGSRGSSTSSTEPPTPPGKDYVFGEHGNPSSSSSTSTTDDSSDDKKKSSNRSYQDGRFDDPDPNKYKL